MFYMIIKLRDYFFKFFVYAVIGWIYELFIFYYHDGIWVNRGFLYGPYLPVYGFGMILLVGVLNKILVKRKKNIKDWIFTILIVFISVFVIATLVEYVTHYVLDTFFNIKLWDYSSQFLNINGRVCLNASRNFAIGGTLLLFLVEPIINKFIKNNKKINLISIILFVIIILDFFVTIFTKYM